MTAKHHDPPAEESKVEDAYRRFSERENYLLAAVPEPVKRFIFFGGVQAGLAMDPTKGGRDE